MSLGPLMVDLVGLELSEREKEILQHPLVGGVILFSRNYASPAQIAQLTADIHQLRQPHLLIAVDHEGGRVQRFRNGFTHLPAVGSFKTLYEQQPQSALQLAETTGWLMAAELRAVGVDFSFAPVLDLDYGISDVIGDRAFHHDAVQVSHLAAAYVKGMKHAWMAAVGKHFPGHGAVAVDSHLGLPVDSRPFDTLWQQDIQPFKRLHEVLAGIMPAHIVYEQCDPLPAGFSPFWIQQVLRDKIHFQGAVFSDDLSMAGAAVMGNSTERVAAALQAGCDMVLLCNQPAEVDLVLDNLSCDVDPLRQMRLLRLHGRHPTDRATLLSNPKWKAAVADVTQQVSGSFQLTSF